MAKSLKGNTGEVDFCWIFVEFLLNFWEIPYSQKYTPPHCFFYNFAGWNRVKSQVIGFKIHQISFKLMYKKITFIMSIRQWYFSVLTESHTAIKEDRFSHFFNFPPSKYYNGLFLWGFVLSVRGDQIIYWISFLCFCF